MEMEALSLATVGVRVDQIWQRAHSMLATASTHSIDSVADPLRTQPACDTSAAAEQPLNLAAEISLYTYIHTLTAAPFMTLGFCQPADVSVA